MKDLLVKLNACREACEWAGDKTWQEVYSTCERGDWLLWLFFRTNSDDLRLLTLAKGHVANTVRHLMKDERSIKAVDMAIAFGEGKATRDELDSSAASAFSAAADFAAYAAYDATYDAAYDVSYDVSIASSSSSAYAFSSSAYDAAARKYSLKQSADIVRKYIPIEVWNIND